MYTRVNNYGAICRLKVHFSGGFPLLNLLPALTPKEGKRFYESLPIEGGETVGTYYSSGSFRFSEAAVTTIAGHPYSQTAIFSFPSNDPKRAQRIEKFLKIKFLEMKMTDGNSLIMGRNDIYQNTPPKISITSDQHRTEIKLETQSIQPVLRMNTDGGASPTGYDYTYDFILS